MAGPPRVKKPAGVRKRRVGAAPKASTATAAPKPKVYKPTITAPQAPGAYFRSRGGPKCVVSATGQSLTGVHHALAQVMANGFKYESDSNRAVRVDEILPPVETIPVPSIITKKRRAQYSKREGSKVDHQMEAALKLHKDHGVPLAVFYDKQERKRFFERGIRPLPTAQPGVLQAYTTPREEVRTQIDHLRKRLSLESLLLLYFIASRHYKVIGPQVVVNHGRIGTMADLVLRNQQGEDIVVEVKTGCVKVWTHGRNFKPPYQSQLVTTQKLNLLQLMTTRRCYQFNHPTHTHGEPLLLRLDKEGIHVYKIPRWMYEGEPAFAVHMGC